MDSIPRTIQSHTIFFVVFVQVTYNITYITATRIAARNQDAQDAIVVITAINIVVVDIATQDFIQESPVAFLTY